MQNSTIEEQLDRLLKQNNQLQQLNLRLCELLSAVIRRESAESVNQTICIGLTNKIEFCTEPTEEETKQVSLSKRRKDVTAELEQEINSVPSKRRQIVKSGKLTVYSSSEQVHQKEIADVKGYLRDKLNNLKSFDWFNPDLHVQCEKNPDLFWCPEVAETLQAQKYRLYQDLDDFKSLNEKLNELTGLTFGLVWNGKSKFAKLRCEKKECAFMVFFSIGEGATKIKFDRAIDRNHSIEAHTNQESPKRTFLE